MVPRPALACVPHVANERMSPPRKREPRQPEPRERPNGGVDEVRPEPHRRRARHEREQRPEREPPGMPDMGIGPDERGEINRRYEP